MTIVMNTYDDILCFFTKSGCRVDVSGYDGRRDDGRFDKAYCNVSNLKYSPTFGGWLTYGGDTIVYYSYRKTAFGR